MNPKKSISEVSEHLEISRQGLHKKLKTLGIVPPKEGNTYFIDHSTAKQLFQYEFETKTIAVQVVKEVWEKQHLPIQLQSMHHYMVQKFYALIWINNQI